MKEQPCQRRKKERRKKKKLAVATNAHWLIWVVLFLIHRKSHAARQGVCTARVNFTRLIRPYVITQLLMSDVNLCAVRKRKTSVLSGGHWIGQGERQEVSRCQARSCM